MSRLQVCTLPVHALLHVPQDIRSSGPVSVCWSWVMERFCGLLGIVSKKGRRHPNTFIASRMHQHSLIHFFDSQYDLGLCRLFRVGRTQSSFSDDEPDPRVIPGSTLHAISFHSISNFPCSRFTSLCTHLESFYSRPHHQTPNCQVLSYSCNW